MLQSDILPTFPDTPPSFDLIPDAKPIEYPAWCQTMRRAVTCTNRFPNAGWHWKPVYKFGSDEKMALAPGVEFKGKNQTFRETWNIFGSSLFVANGQAFPGELVRGLEPEREREREKGVGQVWGTG